MRVLVTRPQPEAAALCARLEAMGATPMAEPLLAIRLLDLPWQDWAAERSLQAIIVTSRNALRCLERQPEALARLAHLPLYAVGEATAAHARAIGIAHVIAGPGTAAGLVPVLTSALDPARGPVLELTGRERTIDMAAVLAPMGFAVRTAEAYEAVPATRLQPETLAALDAGRIEAVLLLSARTANTYAALIQMHKQRKNIRNVWHLCLSETIAEHLRPLGPIQTRTATRPVIEELLALATYPSPSLHHRPLP